MVRPVAANIPVSFPYGVKYTNGVIHKGVDFSKGTEGNPIYSIVDATVAHVGYGGWGPAYGNHLICTTTFKGKKKWILYGHMKEIDVKVGQKLKAGQKVGLNGGGVGHKYSGNSTGPHVHVQVGHANNYLAYEDPWPLIDYKAAPPVDPRPMAGAPWFTIATFNMKAPSLTKTGSHRWTKRRDGQVAEIANLDTDVLCVQEAGSGTDLDWLDTHLKPHGLKRVPNGGNWRHIYVSALCEIVASGSFELTPLYQGDTKEAAWAVLKIGSTRTLVTSMHLEEANGSKPDGIRVKQAQSLVAQAAKVADKYEVATSRIFHAGDTNSTGLVAAAMKKLGFVPADVNAWKVTNTVFATINNWVNRAKGGHSDYVFVAAERPVLSWTQKVNAFISDHNAVVAVIASIA